ncbi:DUF4250 domain-containing protein [Photobacterium damselae]|uniref:DUF4250 domain-containing protein n=1 Tax=Photobacterium damselae subsp. damselae TaxID=85581 RepID=A0AAD3ZWR1_PHODD|nr:DUF4250 domain-containing protein [Photobacterium damselae]KAB1178304.1 DUF4250 domain-containing protein [Photobacterium damselae subsp. damselae]KAB1185854.1 DUF4250 domain-containing protein [Photobacterium damselae subsp. damselae]MBF7100661.1 DUF4250 domain-containing protein [Photobacterium damselae]NVO73519.1 DUF4250 domain-containing protein [Photobacterium damselae subsp. damselae]PSB76309.1 DUF4250 domain-containing protein [Photobacterium damselae subsp. damselae]
MDLSKFEAMDPIMLMSIVNMKIRDEFGDLDSLVKFYDIDKDKLIEKLANSGFDYLPEAKQFR